MSQTRLPGISLTQAITQINPSIKAEQHALTHKYFPVMSEDPRGSWIVGMITPPHRFSV